MVVVLLSAVLWSTSHATPNANGAICFPSSSCEYEVADSEGNKHNFSLGGLCTSAGYSATDAQKHSYVLNICGYAPTPCLPVPWPTLYEYGVGVQSWGGPAPAGSTCTTPSGYNVTQCTADCEVLGVGSPEVTLIDPTAPSQGVKLRYTALYSSKDPFWCLSRNYRQITYTIHCDPYMEGAMLVSVSQNSTNYCDYSALFVSSAACPINATRRV